MELGVFIQSPDTQQMGLSLFEEGSRLTDHTNINLVVFYHNYGTIPLKPSFTMLQSSQIWGFEGPIISTDYNTSRFLIKCPTPRKKYYYVWNLDWIYKIRSWEANSIVMQDDGLELIARSQEHYDIISELWKKPTCIMEDFNYETLETLAS